ncbi:SigB/SigF/SigG family RNA polymerase sigma factor [Ihubacter massiliensis]|uniref:SigB/SigF/SigG family RNA polymerase sigma factor n=1 Tax=Hominibacterium faecale TaxID=2839743 RepID=A0A9J6QJL3_9FIRM|nr:MULTISPECIES: SigB/SigF/SigG family RNA polymerase sigma factor [Eubacteriales Family XIII. Incertae Sedis]MCO7123053.1 SigB/SigF/SigG family RNA polymerase sigma factor [Ihubacter massiliensis]MCU7377313.1 SigB/SigF/SigG family RNA polymerase sigma factor [Hominibacterium faecale]MDE8733186.1 SigB/SigF/SigG family RNA polymerase sigma factor [Eubacteriales bacterium DFI.9.88]
MLKEELFNQYQRTKDRTLRNEIVESYLYMVDILIRKYLNKGVEYDDLYQVGAMALIAAVERFDPSKGYEFSSFATPTIIGEIKKYFRDKEWSVKVPRRLKELSGKIQSAREELFNQLQRNPTIPELADYIGYSEEEVLQAMEGSMAYNAYSLNQTFDESGEEGESSALEKYAAIEDGGYDRLEYTEMISKVLNELSDTNKYIFKERFVEDKSQAEIAKRLGVSQMTISRAEKNIRERFQREAQC